MLDTLITSKTRIKLLLKFFLNPNTSSYLRSLEGEFGESSNSIRLELNRLEKAEMLQTNVEGNKKFFSVNKLHPLFEDVNRIVRKYVGIDVIISNILKGLGNLKRVYLTGDLAKGKDSKVIDLVLIGDIDRAYLIEMIEKTEALISRKIRYVIYTEEEFETMDFDNKDYLLIWTA
ncbi:MAG: ArsR family transcriptional regulator [Flammeovirgaceae bacterium]